MIPITCNAVGDIIALASLIIDVARALNDTRGSASEYRSFTDELNGFHTMLSTAARVAKDTDDDALRGEIIREVDRCGRDVQGALDRIAKFSVLDGESASGGTQRMKLKRNWYKVKWHLTQHEDTQTFRKELTMATQRLTTLLVVSNTDGATRFRTTLLNRFDYLVSRDNTLSSIIDRNTAALGDLQLASRRDRGTVQELSKEVPHWVDSKTAAAAVLCAAICAMHSPSPYDRVAPTALLLVALCILMRSSGYSQRMLVQNVGYSETNGVPLLDAFGRRIILPWELCGSNDILHATLVNLFAGTSGQWFVETRRYSLNIDFMVFGDFKPDWEYTIQICKEVRMSIVIQDSKPVYRFSDPSDLVCPVCDTLNVLHDRYNGEQCLGCQRTLGMDPGFDSARLLACASDEDVPEDHQVIYNQGQSRRLRPKVTTLTSPLGVKQTGSSPSNGATAQLEHVSDSDNRPRSTDSWTTLVRDFARIEVWSPRVDCDLGYGRLYGFVGSSFRNCCDFLSAAENGHHELVSALLSTGVDVNTRSVSGHTALHFASWIGHVRVIKLLLDHGAEIDATAGEFLSPLAYAVLRRQHGATKLLLMRGSMVEAPKPVQTRVLYAAAMSDNIDVVRMLLSMGVDVNTRICASYGYDGQTTVLEVAVEKKSDKVVELLLHPSTGVHVDPELLRVLIALTASEFLDPHEHIFKLLFATQKSIYHATSLVMSDVEKVKLLRSAIWGGNHNIVETVLLETGIDVNSRFSDGSTALSLACERALRGPDVVDLLLAHGGDPNMDAFPKSSYSGQCQGKWKPLHAAVYHLWGGEWSLVDILLQNGADVDARAELDGCSHTPLSLFLQQVEYHGHTCGGYQTTDSRQCDWHKTVDLFLSKGAGLDECSWMLLQQLEDRCERQRNHNPPGALRQTHNPDEE